MVNWSQHNNHSTITQLSAQRPNGGRGAAGALITIEGPAAKWRPGAAGAGPARHLRSPPCARLPRRPAWLRRAAAGDTSRGVCPWRRPSSLPAVSPRPSAVPPHPEHGQHAGGGGGGIRAAGACQTEPSRSTDDLFRWVDASQTHGQTAVEPSQPPPYVLAFYGLVRNDLETRSIDQFEVFCKPEASISL